jgi:hypothetical protein
MRDKSVFRVRHFVQMGAAVQIKFKSSVAAALHFAQRYPKLEQDLRPMPRSASGPFAVDPALAASFTHLNKLGKRDGRGS